MQVSKGLLHMIYLQPIPCDSLMELIQFTSVRVDQSSKAMTTLCACSQAFKFLFISRVDGIYLHLLVPGVLLLLRRCFLREMANVYCSYPSFPGKVQCGQKMEILLWALLVIVKTYIMQLLSLLEMILMHASISMFGLDGHIQESVKIH